MSLDEVQDYAKTCGESGVRMLAKARTIHNDTAEQAEIMGLAKEFFALRDAVLTACEEFQQKVVPA